MVRADSEDRRPEVLRSEPVAIEWSTRVLDTGEMLSEEERVAAFTTVVVVSSWRW